MRATGYRTVDALVDWLTDPSQPPIRRAEPADAPATPRRPRTDDRPAVRRDARRSLPRRDPVREPLGSPPLLRVRPVRRHVARRARRLRRERVQRLRGLVDGIGRAERSSSSRSSAGSRTGSATRPRPAARSSTGGSAANLTALVCAREARAGVDAATTSSSTSPTRRTRRSHARAHPRLPTRPGARASRWATTCGSSRRRSPPRSTADEARGPACRSSSSRTRGATSSGAIDPLDGARRASAASTVVWLHVDAAYGGFAVLTERGRARARRDRARRLDHARPAQVALPAVRVRLPARARRPGASRRVRDQLRLPPRRGARERRGELRRPRPAAEPLVARVQALALAAHVRARRIPRRDRRMPRPGRAGATAPIEASDRLELVAPPSLGTICFRRQTARTTSVTARARRGARGRAASASSPRRACTGAPRCGSASSTTRARPPTSSRCWRSSSPRSPVAAASLTERDQVFGPRRAAVRPARADRGAGSSTRFRRSDARAARETVVERWETNRDFYVVEDGTVDVTGRR